MAEALIGTITHYFAKPQVGVLKLTGGLTLGDTLHVTGHGADFQQTVTSMEVDHVPVQAAPAGTEIAIKIGQKVREGTPVFRVTP